MFKEVVRTLDSGVLASIGLVAFVVAFVLVVAYAFLMPRRARTAMKNLPLHDALAADGPAREAGRG